MCGFGVRAGSVPTLTSWSAHESAECGYPVSISVSIRVYLARASLTSTRATRDGAAVDGQEVDGAEGAALPALLMSDLSAYARSGMHSTCLQLLFSALVVSSFDVSDRCLKYLPTFCDRERDRCRHVSLVRLWRLICSNLISEKE